MMLYVLSVFRYHSHKIEKEQSELKYKSEWFFFRKVSRVNNKRLLMNMSKKAMLFKNSLDSTIYVVR